LRRIGLPAVVANAIQEKLRREQEAEQMKFVLQKEQQEAERKRIEAQGIADFQGIVAQGISQRLLEWKGIEATEKLAASPNSKIVVVGNTKSACRWCSAATGERSTPGGAHMNRLVLAAIGVGILVGAVQPRAQQQEFGFPNIKRLGKATVQYRNPQLQVVLNYEYSQRKHDSAWLLVDFAARSEKRLVLDREHFKLVSQAGEWFPIASQRHFLEAANEIQSLRQNASVWRRDLSSYLGALAVRDRLKFFSLPGEGVIVTGALLDWDRNTFGELYFEMPRGAWESGEYALLIEHPQASIKLPISLN
jgi:hypothetical protein